MTPARQAAERVAHWIMELDDATMIEDEIACQLEAEFRAQQAQALEEEADRWKALAEAAQDAGDIAGALDKMGVASAIRAEARRRAGTTGGEADG